MSADKSNRGEGDFAITASLIAQLRTFVAAVKHCSARFLADKALVELGRMTGFTASMAALQYLITNSWTLQDVQQILWMLSSMTMLRVNMALCFDRTSYSRTELLNDLAP